MQKLLYGTSIFSLHRFNRNHPLFAEFADINTVDELSVGDRLSKRAFIQPPKLGSIRKSHQTVEGSLDLYTIFPKFVTREVKIIIPNDTVTANIDRYRIKFVNIIF